VSVKGKLGSTVRGGGGCVHDAHLSEKTDAQSTEQGKKKMGLFIPEKGGGMDKNGQNGEHNRTREVTYSKASNS